MAERKVAGQIVGKAAGPPDLVELLEQAGEGDLEKLQERIVLIDEEIGALKRRRGSMESARKMISMRLLGTQRAKPGQQTKRRDEIYEFLSANSPAGPLAINKATGIPIGAINKLLKHEWFDRVDEGWVIAKTGKGE